MSDNEQQIYMQISNKIKEKYLDAQITNQKLSINQTKYPAVSIVLTNNSVLSQYSTFDQIESYMTVCISGYTYVCAESRGLLS